MLRITFYSEDRPPVYFHGDRLEITSYHVNLDKKHIAYSTPDAHGSHYEIDIDQSQPKHWFHWFEIQQIT